MASEVKQDNAADRLRISVEINFAAS